MKLLAAVCANVCEDTQHGRHLAATVPAWVVDEVLGDVINTPIHGNPSIVSVAVRC
jgi:hypothetical protein